MAQIPTRLVISGDFHRGLRDVERSSGDSRTHLFGSRLRDRFNKLSTKALQAEARDQLHTICVIVYAAGVWRSGYDDQEQSPVKAKSTCEIQNLTPDTVLTRREWHP